MARTGRLVLLTAALLVVARVPLPSNLALAGARALARPLPESRAPVVASSHECVVYVDNLAADLTKSDLADHMGQAGEVVQAKRLADGLLHHRPFRARIHYKTPQEAKAAIAKLQNSQLGERCIRVVPADPECRVIVQNLGCRVQYDELEEHMRQAGDIVVADIYRNWGRPAVAYVYYNTPQDAEVSVEKLHGSELGGRTIYVSESTERGSKVFAGNLPKGAAGQDLQDVFNAYGKVLKVHLRSDGESALIQFKKAAEAQAAVGALNDSNFQGQKMVVEMPLQHRGLNLANRDAVSMPRRRGASKYL